MIPLGSTLPHDSDSLRAGLAQGLSPVGLGDSAVTLVGDFPQLAALHLDLTGARLSRDLPVPKSAGKGSSICFAREVSLRANPATAEGVPFTLAVQAEDVVLSAAPNSAGGFLLLFDKAGRGTFDFSAKRDDLEKALLALAREAAEKQGAEVKSVRLELAAKGPRSLAVRAIVTAKAMFFTTTVTAAGQVEINDALEARLHGLECTGDGMAGKLAAGFLRPKFAAFEGRAFPLGQMVSGLTLREINVRVDDALHLHAQFGGV